MPALRLGAQAPAWWAARGVLASGATPNDYASANLGQVKRLAAHARDEMQASLPGGAGSAINAVVDSWSASPASGVVRNDYAAINIGQVKALAKLYYDRLAAFSYAGQPLSSGQTYPWTSTTADDNDFAAANIGQVKRVFSFDPGAVSLGTFSLDGTMVLARHGQDSSVQLNDGRVLIVGGSVPTGGTSVSTNTTEIYDPATGTFAAGPTMAKKREGALVAKLNDGRVFVAGGFDDATDTCHVSAQIFDPATNTFSTISDLPEDRHSASAVTLQDGRVLLYGGLKHAGYNDQNWHLAVHYVAHLYNPATDTYQEIYMPTHETWTPAQTPAVATHAMLYADAVLLPSGKVLISGGKVATNRLSDRMYTFNPDTDDFSAIGAMSVTRSGHAGTLRPDGKVLLVGGNTSLSGSPTASCDLFDPATETITATLAMTVARSGHRLAWLPDGRLLITGPQSTGAEIHHPASGAFIVPTSQPSVLRAGGFSYLLPNGKVLIGSGTIAGAPPASNSATQAEWFTP